MYISSLLVLLAYVPRVHFLQMIASVMPERSSKSLFGTPGRSPMDVSSSHRPGPSWRLILGPKSLPPFGFLLFDLQVVTGQGLDRDPPGGSLSIPGPSWRLRLASFFGLVPLLVFFGETFPVEQSSFPSSFFSATFLNDARQG